MHTRVLVVHVRVCVRGMARGGFVRKQTIHDISVVAGGLWCVPRTWKPKVTEGSIGFDGLYSSHQANIIVNTRQQRNQSITKIYFPGWAAG